MRYDVIEMNQTMTEVLACGTDVQLEPLDDRPQRAERVEEASEGG